ARQTLHTTRESSRTVTFVAPNATNATILDAERPPTNKRGSMRDKRYNSRQDVTRSALLAMIREPQFRDASCDAPVLRPVRHGFAAASSRRRFAPRVESAGEPKSARASGMQRRDSRPSP